MAAGLQKPFLLQILQFGGKCAEHLFPDGGRRSSASPQLLFEEGGDKAGLHGGEFRLQTVLAENAVQKIYAAAVVFDLLRFGDRLRDRFGICSLKIKRYVNDDGARLLG